MPALHAPDPALPPLFGLATALAAGMTRDQVRQRVRSGKWQRMGRGWYLRRETLDEPDPHLASRRLHQLRSVAAARRVPGSTVCGPSAAILHGLPVLEVPNEVHLIAPPGGWTGHRAGMRLHEWVLPDHHLDVAPLRLTTLPRSWVDLARANGVIGAVVAGDHILRADAATRVDLARAIAELAGSQLLGHARTALGLLEPRRESPLESASGCYFHQHDVPPPQWQVDLFDTDGFIGRADCTWDGTRLVGEADGRFKYLAPDDLYREKRREDRIRATGRYVIRWGWTDLQTDRLAQRILAALENPTRSVARTPGM